MIVLDTHIWVRWLLSVDPLPAPLVTRIQEEDQVGMSAISCWEVTMLAARQRIELPLAIDDWINEATSQSGVDVIPIRLHHRETGCRFASAPS